MSGRDPSENPREPAPDKPAETEVPADPPPEEGAGVAVETPPPPARGPESEPS